jgi:hypothetical protein
MADKLDNLTPEMRLQKLKELKKEAEKEKKEVEKEIKEAEAKIKDTREELKDKKEFEEIVPIPQVAAESVEGLSEDEKLIFKMQKGLKNKKDSQDTDDDTSNPKSSDDTEVAIDSSKSLPNVSLEETVRNEQIMHQMQGDNSQFQEYIVGLSQQPMENLYQEITTLYGAAKESGYLSSDQQSRLQNLGSAIEQKVKDVEAGNYSFTKETAKAASASQSIKKNLDIFYNSNSDIHDNNSGLYRT